MKIRRYIYLAGSTLLLLTCLCLPVSAGAGIIAGTAQAAKDLIMVKCRIYSFYIMAWSVGAGVAVSLLGFAVAFVNRDVGARLVKSGAFVAIAAAVAHLFLANS